MVKQLFALSPDNMRVPGFRLAGSIQSLCVPILGHLTQHFEFYSILMFISLSKFISILPDVALPYFIAY